MKVIVDATPIIALSMINRLEILHELFDEALVNEYGLSGSS